MSELQKRLEPFGVNKEMFASVVVEVMENKKLLESCERPNDFSICLDRRTKQPIENPTPGQRFGAKWKCSKCRRAAMKTTETNLTVNSKCIMRILNRRAGDDGWCKVSNVLRLAFEYHVPSDLVEFKKCADQHFARLTTEGKIAVKWL